MARLIMLTSYILLTVEWFGVIQYVSDLLYVNLSVVWCMSICQWFGVCQSVSDLVYVNMSVI